jgi:hypothetical protein
MLAGTEVADEAETLGRCDADEDTVLGANAGNRKSVDVLREDRRGRDNLQGTLATGLSSSGQGLGWQLAEMR